MKKILNLILLFVFCTTIAKAQDNDFEDPSVIDSKIFTINLNTFDDLCYNFYGFKMNGIMYILSYRSNDESNWMYPKRVEEKRNFVNRDMILYSSDGLGWKIASNIIQTDYRFASLQFDYGTHLVTNSENYDVLLTKGISSGNICVTNNGYVVMILTNKYSYVNFNQKIVKTYTYNSVVIMKANGNGTYKATRFEPQNKLTKYPKLAANDKLDVEIINNKILIKCWNKIQVTDNGKFDGYFTLEGKVTSIKYRRKLTDELTFIISGEDVIQSTIF